MAQPKLAIAITLQHEGGYQCDPDDHANWSSGQCGVGELIGTKYGITAVDMPGITADAMKNLTPEQATAFYSERYWKAYYSQIDSQAVADKLFDMGVLFGVGTATKILQDVLGVGQDGLLGPATLGVLNATTRTNELIFLQDYRNALHIHASLIAGKNPKEAKNIKGWNSRIDS